MSKRNKHKFRHRDANRSMAAASTASGVATAVSSPAPMGGKVDRSSGAFAQHAAEYRTIRNDMIRLVVLNGIMLIAVFVLYYANRSSGIVEKLYSQLVH